MRSPTLARLSTAALACIFAATAGAQIQDGSFEQHVVPRNDKLAYQYNGFQPGPPSTPAAAIASSWTFSGGAGLIRGTGTDFNTPSPFPNGSQVAFIQGVGSFISQGLTLTPGTYQLTFQTAGRSASGWYDGNTSFDVSFGGGSILTSGTASYQGWTSNSISFVASGNGTLSFANTSAPGDHTFFVDDVSLTRTSTATPEPASLALVGGGLLALAGVVRRRRA